MGTNEIEIEEGCILTLENGSEILLIERTPEGFFAVEVVDDIPNDLYYLVETVDVDGETFLNIKRDLQEA